MQYTKQDGTIGNLPTTPEQEAFAARAMELLADPSIGEVELSAYLFGDSPFEHVQSDGDGGLRVTSALMGTPQFSWMLDVMAQKIAQQKPTGDEYTLPMSEVLEHTKIDELTLRRLVDRAVLDARLIGGTWIFADDTIHKTNDLARAYTMTTKQAAEACGCAEVSIRKMIEGQRLPAIKINARWRLNPDDVDAIELENRGPRKDTLTVRCGRNGDWKLLFKADQKLEVDEKFTGGVAGTISGQWHRAVVLTETKTEGDGPQQRRCFLIRYSRSDQGSELHHGEMFVRGSFKIEEHTNNPIESKRMYERFVEGLV
jgi:excisionase family DNA binding protein